jgi:hypothetical protein
MRPTSAHCSAWAFALVPPLRMILMARARINDAMAEIFAPPKPAANGLPGSSSSSSSSSSDASAASAAAPTADAVARAMAPVAASLAAGLRFDANSNDQSESVDDGFHLWPSRCRIITAVMVTNRCKAMAPII